MELMRKRLMKLKTWIVVVFNDKRPIKKLYRSVDAVFCLIWGKPCKIFLQGFFMDFGKSLLYKRGSLLLIRVFA